MKVLDVNISNSVFYFLKSKKNTLTSIEKANQLLQKECGVKDFFSNKLDLLQVTQELNGDFTNTVQEKNAEYGDFQTNQNLANQVTTKLKKDGLSPQIVLEPTCGKGHFILAALNTFDNIEIIFGIEIQKKHIWQAKFNILDFFLNNPNKKKPEVYLYHSSIFNFDYQIIKQSIGKKELLIIGNPPWVTNSALSAMNSKNLPQKSNFKQNKGLDAMTGKGNFDIAEYITIDLLKNFGNYTGNMAFLIKNTVIKNIVFNIPNYKFPIANLQKQNIDSKKEFNVSVDAALFICQLNKNTDYICQEFDFYSSIKKCDFGWQNNRFMSDLSKSSNEIDGISPFEWRQGIKHDCSKVMELEVINDIYHNKLGEQFSLEDDLIYPLLKSSDLKAKIANPTRKVTIVTQKYIGQDTHYIKQFPLTFDYLNNHIDLFRMRKSSIYKGKCDFSIFGIGDYSFKPYKIAISGLYKTFHFCLVKPQNGKPVMLDDTCYFIGFDTLEQAEYIWNLLNNDIVENLLKSISFKDAKRMITKDILMRIDLKKVAQIIEYKPDFLKNINKKEILQLSLFDLV